MSDLFTIYEDNLKNCLEKIKTTSETLSSSGNFNDAFNLISEGEGIIKQMQLESSSTTNKNIKNQYNSKINNYSNSLSEYKKSTRKLQDKFTTDKQSKLFTLDGKPNEKGNLIANEEYAYSSSQKLEEAKRVLASTEDTSNKIMSNMEEQSQKMKNVNIKISGMNDSLDGSNTLMNSMQLRLRKNKKIITIFGIVLLGILALTITMKIVF